MRKGGSKQKGASFERSVCKDLSLWISGGKYDDLFWRSAMSGGRATVSINKGRAVSSGAGDITAISSISTKFIDCFSIECKFYQDLELLSAFKGRRGKIFQFFDQAKKDARKPGKKKIPILIAKQNYFPTFMCVDDLGEAVIGLPTNRCKPMVIYNLEGLRVYDFNMFLTKVSPKQWLDPTTQTTK